MDIQIYRLIEGAKQAEGLTVIIDVFRAFSMECWLYALGAKEVRPVGSIGETFAWRERDSGCILVGERHGAKIDGCDLGNSPSSFDPEMIRGKRIIHTTSAGTQGIENAVLADEIITGSLVNARAAAAYIRKRAPEKVSLVAMGNAGVKRAGEDLLCAEYIKSLLEDKPMDIQPLADALRYTEGAKFFDPEQTAFPAEDFAFCVACDRFPFVIRLEKDPQGRKILRPFQVPSL